MVPEAALRFRSCRQSTVASGPVTSIVPQVGRDENQNQNERGKTIDSCCLLKVEALEADRSPQEDEGNGRAAEGDRGREQSTPHGVQREERPDSSQDAAQATQDRQERSWHVQPGLPARRIGEPPQEAEGEGVEEQEGTQGGH